MYELESGIKFQEGESPLIKFQEGESPLIVSVPHAGTHIPPEIKARMRPESLFLPDTDWFVDKLYSWAPAEGASMIASQWSRYLIDLNRPPDNTPLYEDSFGTSLVPEETFTGVRIYREGQAPDRDEIQQRLETYWRPYHERLLGLIETTRERHGYAILLDGHSIRSVLPKLFEGELPHLNLGSISGSSASTSLVSNVLDLLTSRGIMGARKKTFMPFSWRLPNASTCMNFRHSGMFPGPWS
jgi:N-formylglutamate amidohydrolase